MWLLLFTSLLVTDVASGECQFPAQLTGLWNSSFSRWDSYLNITNTTIHSLPTGGKNLPFSCYLQNGTTFIIESQEQRISSVSYHFYTCLDIVPSPSSNDVVYFYLRTDLHENHGNYPVKSLLTTDNKTYADICQKNSSEFPVLYDIFFRKGFENQVRNESCPSTLQAVFTVNVTGPSAPKDACPDGFDLNGCDRSHLTFNYSSCRGAQPFTGTPNYTCLATATANNVTYTTIFMMNRIEGEQPNAFDLACLEQTTVDGQLMITKSSRTCGAEMAVNMAAREILSCRRITTPGPEPVTEPGTNVTEPGTNVTEPGTNVTEPGTNVTEPGANATIQTPTSGSKVPETGDRGQGGRSKGEGDGTSLAAAVTSAGLAAIFLPILAHVWTIALRC